MPSSPHSVQEHIELIARHEQEFLERRTGAERIGDTIAGFAGSLTFVCFHLAFFSVWLWLNTTNHRHFDPVPFSLLSTVITMEAILLASFILMRQARIGRRADERDHLMLQVLLLAERENTALLEVNREIAKELGLGKLANKSDIRELSKQISVEEMAETIRDNMPNSE